MKGRLRALFWIAGLALLFALYTSGLGHNPPGFYLDESAAAYNACLVSNTGAGEFGPRFPLFFQYYTDGLTQIADPTQIYLLAAVFRFFPPSILLARMFSAFWVFAACLLLGLLARRISGRRTIGVIVAATALLTPWFFDGRGLLLEPQFVPMALAPFLLTLYHVQRKESWNWLEVAMLAATLALVTYCYTSGRLLGPLLALGLLFFATTRQRLISVIKAGLLYGVTLVPILVFNSRNPGVLTKRFNEVSYIKPGVPLSEVLSHFIKRYLEDLSLNSLLMTGDILPRHHVPGSGGAFFFATFILAIIGLVIVIARRRRDPWWRFILYGIAIAIVPGAISVWPFHEMRLMAYPVFLVLLTVPALEWLLARDTQNRIWRHRSPTRVGSHSSRLEFQRVLCRALLACSFCILCWRSVPWKPAGFRLSFAVMDQIARLILTLITRTLTTRRPNNPPGRSILRTENGVRPTQGALGLCLGCFVSYLGLCRFSRRLRRRRLQRSFGAHPQLDEIF